MWKTKSKALIYLLEDSTLNLILDILDKVYRGECLLRRIESEFPFMIVELVRLCHPYLKELGLQNACRMLYFNGNWQLIPCSAN